MRVVETPVVGHTRFVAPVRRSLPLLLWIVMLSALLVGMHFLGRGALAGPPLDDPGVWRGWIGARGAPDAVMVVLRLVVQSVAWYLLAVSLLGIVVRVLRARPLVVAADVVTLPFVRRVLQAGLGAGLAGAALVPTGVAFAAAVPAAPTAVSVVAPGAPDDDVAPVLQRLDAVAPAPALAPTGTWTVAPGEHLWSIAERVLREAWSRPPSDREITSFWREVIAQNRGRLAHPDNPDLIFPGQVLLVPSPSAPG
jgi:hypothetical protein